MALASASRPKPRSHKGQVVEVDLARQLLLVVVDGQTYAVMDASTGARQRKTPKGHFQVRWQTDGYNPKRRGMYRPKYFNGGVAVHGYPSVPPHPASHGCVRVTNAAMDWLWRTDTLKIGARIWVY
jgi:lipoprotein-anchoring transpeptidase ErfK/SrfK